MDVKLRVTSGKHAGKEIPIAGAQFLIGRAEDCQLRASSDLISRHHCLITISDSYVGVRDFGSRNGTLVNSERIEGEVELRGGDILSVGPLKFEIVSSHTVGGKKRPAVKDVEEAAVRVTRPSKQQSVEQQISDWIGLADPDSTSRRPPGSKTEQLTDTTALSESPSAVDTQSVKLSETDRIDPADPSPNGNAGNVPSSAAVKKRPGKLPELEVPKSSDSREAAAQILRKLNKRK